MSGMLFASVINRGGVMQIDSSQKIQVRFTVTDQGQTFTDALYFTSEEYAALTERELAEMQRARFDAWLALVQAPPLPPVELSPEEIRGQIEQLQTQADALIAQLPE